MEKQEPIFSQEDSFEHGAALGGLKIRVESQQFRSGRVTAVLSGVTVDLRDATLSVQSALSGIDILVPRDWQVVCDIDPIFGGVDAERFSRASPSAKPALRVTGTVVAGALSVR